MMSRSVSLAAMAVFLAGGLLADGGVPAGADSLNAVLRERSEKLSEAQRLERACKTAFLQASNTSPEIEKARKDVDRLSRELAAAQKKVRDLIGALPQVKEAGDRAARLRQEAAELTKKADALMAEREKKAAQPAQEGAGK